MALAFDAVANGKWVSGTTFSFTHVCTGSDVVLILCVATDDTAGTVHVTKATCGNLPFTFVAGENLADPAGDGKKSEVWYLPAPPTGSNTVQVTISGSPTLCEAGTVSFTGADQTANVIDGKITAHFSSATNPSVSVQTTTPNTILVNSLCFDHGLSVAVDGNDTQIYNNTTDSFSDGVAAYRATTGSAGLYATGYTASAGNGSMSALGIRAKTTGNILKPQTIRPAMFKPGNAR